MRQTATFTINVDYDDRRTDPDALGEALDRLMEMALSTPGILDDYGKVEVGTFEIPSDGGGDTRSSKAKTRRRLT